jgi:hypothetical protein
VSSNKQQVFKKGFARQHCEISAFQPVDLHWSGDWFYNGGLAEIFAAAFSLDLPRSPFTTIATPCYPLDQKSPT